MSVMSELERALNEVASDLADVTYDPYGHKPHEDDDDDEDDDD